MKRKQLSKKARFEVFKRDGFVCHYCGAKPPQALLQVDHILPVSKGGTNDFDNLITSCQACNLGKSNTLLNDVKPDMRNAIREMKERESQIEEYRKYVKKAKRRLDVGVGDIESIFQETFPDLEFADSFRITIKSQFLANLDVDECMAAMVKACGMMENKGGDAAIKYFCGICWRTIKKDGRYA